MKVDTRPTEAGERYAAAHAAHYRTQNLRQALELYKGILVQYPNAPEAGYCRSQIHNITQAVVPAEEILDAELTLALAHFES